MKNEDSCLLDLALLIRNCILDQNNLIGFTLYIWTLIYVYENYLRIRMYADVSVIKLSMYYVVNEFLFLIDSDRFIMLSGSNTNLCSISHSV